MKTWECMSWHVCQLAEQTIKIHLATTWQLAVTRWLTPVKAGYNFESKNAGYDLLRIRLWACTTWLAFH